MSERPWQNASNSNDLLNHANEFIANGCCWCCVRRRSSEKMPFFEMHAPQFYRSNSLKPTILLQIIAYFEHNFFLPLNGSAVFLGSLFLRVSCILFPIFFCLSFAVQFKRTFWFCLLQNAHIDRLICYANAERQQWQGERERNAEPQTICQV